VESGGVRHADEEERRVKVSLMRRLEVWVIALLLLCQGTQALHIHTPTVSVNELSYPVAAVSASDAPCPVCWAHQALGSSVPEVTERVCISMVLASLTPYCAPVIVVERAPFAPRGPPVA
jgi:hypothetical protein